jgi:hypothetical protein
MGKHNHDGFYLSLQLPVGQRNIGFQSPVGEMKAEGFGGGFTLAIGGVVARNLVVYGEVGGVTVTDPKLSTESQSVETENASMSLTQFGPGIAYYIMPLNVYVGASAMLSGVSVESEGETVAKSKLGFGGALRAGKEFWVSNNWGLGLGVEARFANAKDDAGDVSATGFSVVLGGTYN